MMNARELMFWIYGWICLKNGIKSGSNYYLTEQLMDEDGIFCPPGQITDIQRSLIFGRLDTYRRCENRLFPILGEWLFSNILTASNCPLRLLERRLSKFCEKVDAPTSRDIEAFILGYMELTENPSTLYLTYQQALIIIRLLERNLDGLCPAMSRLYHVITEQLECQVSGYCAIEAIKVHIGSLYDYLYKTFYGEYLPKPIPLAAQGGGVGPSNVYVKQTGGRRSKKYCSEESEDECSEDECSEYEEDSESYCSASESESESASGECSEVSDSKRGGNNTVYVQGNNAPWQNFAPGNCSSSGLCCAPPYRSSLMNGAGASIMGFQGGEGYTFWNDCPYYQRNLIAPGSGYGGGYGGFGSISTLAYGLW